MRALKRNRGIVVRRFSFLKKFYYYYFSKFYFTKHSYLFFIKSISLKRKNTLLKFILYRNWNLSKRKYRNSKFFFNKFIKKKVKKFFYKPYRRPFDLKHKFIRHLLENYKITKKLFFNRFTKSKTIMRFFRSNRFQPVNKLFVKLEFYLFNILLRSRFILFFNDLFFFITNGYVFVNGKIVKNPFFKVTVGDRVQLIIFKNYYYYYKRYLLVFYKSVARAKAKVWKINRNKKNYYKQISRHVPAKVFKALTYKVDVPKYLEIDYLMLLVIPIFQPNNQYYLNFLFFRFISNYMIRLYLWKKKS